jgi:hypothetical protein
MDRFDKLKQGHKSYQNKNTKCSNIINILEKIYLLFVIYLFFIINLFEIIFSTKLNF